MGYELNRIMKQYGVSTPGVVNYSGTAAPSVPTAPADSRPAGEDAEAKAAQGTYDKQLADFNAYKADPAAFNETMRKYGLEQKSYDTYKTDYQNRLQNTPMYAQGQFQATPQLEAKTVADLYKMFLGRDPEAGIVGNAAASTRPDFMQEAQRELNSRPGLGNQNLANATGSYYGNQLKSPTYGAMPASMISATPQEKSDYYLQQRNLGYNNADLRTASENTFGKVNEGDWAQMTARAYPAYNQNIVDAYKSIGRSWDAGTIDAPGYNDWMNQVSSGAFNPKDLNSTFAQIAANEKAAADAKAARLATTTNVVNSDKPISPNDPNYLIYDLDSKYAHGGRIKTHYQTAGAVELPSGYGSLEEEDAPPAPVAIVPVAPNVGEPVPATVIGDAPKSALTEIAVNNARDASEPVAVPAPVAVVAVAPNAAMPLGDERMASLRAMLAAYGRKDSPYAADLKAARERATAESDAFAKMLTGAMSSPEDAQSSKAEMYFRLAAAFGAPTKTGQFSENLGKVGEELGEFAKGKRASAREKQLLGLEVQKLRMGASKEDLDTLRALSAEDMKDRRTEAYQKRVAATGDANLAVAQGNLAVRQRQLANQQAQQNKLTPFEMRLKAETSQALVTMRDAYTDLKEALKLNKNAYDNSWVDQGQYKLLSAAGSKDPKVVNTGVLNNLLKLGALSTAVTTLKTQISDSDMKMLNQVQGIGANSKQERADILEAAIARMKNLYTEKKAKLAEINQGLYRETTDTPGTIEELP